MRATHAPKLAVWKFASCDGCQLSLLDCEDELLALAEVVRVANFLEASRAVLKGPYDLSLVEGSITTPHDAERIHQVRRASRVLVTIGACATAGGIQAMRNWSNEPEWRASVYPNPEYVESLATATPVADHVQVDAELRGCPIDGRQLVELLTALRLGRRPQLPDEAVCNECKRKGRVCVLVASDLPCLGPVTATGCGALCPGYDRACYACFGPKDQPNTASLAAWIGATRSPDQVDRLFAMFNGYAPAFRDAAQRAVPLMQPAPRPRTSKATSKRTSKGKGS